MEQFNPNKHIAENMADLEAQGFGYWEDGEWHHTGKVEMMMRDFSADILQGVQEAIAKISWGMFGGTEIKPGDK